MSLPILFPIRPKVSWRASLPLPISSAIATPTPAPINPPVRNQNHRQLLSLKSLGITLGIYNKQFQYGIHLHTFGQFYKLGIYIFNNHFDLLGPGISVAINILAIATADVNAIFFINILLF